MAKTNSTVSPAYQNTALFEDLRPESERLGPYLIDTDSATGTLDEAIGALTLAYEAVCYESGNNRALTAAWSAMRMAIRSLDALRDTLAEAKTYTGEVAHG